MSTNANGRFKYETFPQNSFPGCWQWIKNNRLNVCYDLREQVGNNPQILSKVVTGDETWCYGYDAETEQVLSQWKTPNSPKPKKAWQVWSYFKIMLISFFMLMELCTRNLFLLDQLWINFIWSCWKDRTIVYGKSTRNVERRWLALSPRQCPFLHGLVCAAVFGKKQHGCYSSSSIFTRPCALRPFPVPSYEMPDETECFADVS